MQFRKLDHSCHSYHTLSVGVIKDYYRDFVEHFERSASRGFGWIPNKPLDVCALVSPLDPPQQRSRAASSAASDVSEAISKRQIQGLLRHGTTIEYTYFVSQWWPVHDISLWFISNTYRLLPAT